MLRYSRIYQKSKNKKKIKLCYITNFCPRRICSINNEYQNKQQEINKWIERTNILERQKVLQEKTKKQNSRIPFVLTCVRTLPNVKRAIANNLDLVYVNREFKDMFQQSPISPLKKTELEQKPLWLTKMQEYCRWENAETIQEKARIFN